MVITELEKSGGEKARKWGCDRDGTKGIRRERERKNENLVKASQSSDQSSYNYGFLKESLMFVRIAMIELMNGVFERREGGQ